MIQIEQAKVGLHVWVGEFSNPKYGIIEGIGLSYVAVRFPSFDRGETVRLFLPDSLNWPPRFVNAFGPACPEGQVYLDG